MNGYQSNENNKIDYHNATEEHLLECEEIEVEAAGLDGTVIDSLLKEQNSE